MTANPRRALLAVLLPLLLTASSAPALDLGGHDRDGVVISGLVGHSWNNLTFELPGQPRETTDYNGAFSGGIGVGWAWSDQFVGSVGLWGWKKSFVQNITPISFRNFQFTVDALWFPRGQGLWLHGGVGLGDVDLTIRDAADIYTVKDTGLVTVLGAGYEFRVSDTTAVGVAYDAHWLTIDKFEQLGEITSVSQALSFSVRWYYQ